MAARGRLTLQAIPGMTLGTLLATLARHRGHVDAAHLDRLAYLFLVGLYNTTLRWLEEWDNGARIRTMRIEPPPVFILGQWRSGTSHLHNLLARHPDFHAPTLYQCLFPHHFAYTQRRGGWVLDRLAPKTRPMDGVAVSAGSPYEDEFALAALCGISPYLRFLFPRDANNPRAVLDPLRLPTRDRARWRQAFHHFLQKQMFTKGRRLVLKSPPHMGRVATILEMLPEARFIHIHRHPYEVFASSRKLWRDGIVHSHLQRPDPVAIDELILAWHLELFTLFQRDRAAILPGHLAEVRFEDLVRDPEACLRRIFADLDLPEFGRFWPPCRDYLASLQGYRRNVHALDAADRARVAAHWQPMFTAYGYPC